MTTVVLDHVEVRLSIEQVIAALHQLSEDERKQVWHEFEQASPMLDSSTARLVESRQSQWDKRINKRIKQLEQEQQIGYERHPATAAEFESWQSEQAWGDE
jgi:hypothetical protein